MNMTLEDIVHHLALQPHPEGGWYRETYRDPNKSGGRSVGTAIYYLLGKREVSHWHRVDAAEIWHHYMGAPLHMLTCEKKGGTVEAAVLGSDLAAGQYPQLVVKAGYWQSARCDGDWALAGCTVAPGFEFEGFELAPPGWKP